MRPGQARGRAMRLGQDREPGDAAKWPITSMYYIWDPCIRFVEGGGGAQKSFYRKLHIRPWNRQNFTVNIYFWLERRGQDRLGTGHKPIYCSCLYFMKWEEFSQVLPGNLFFLLRQNSYGYYRVSHIKLDRVNGSKLRFGGQIRKFKKNESFWKI